MAYLLNIDVDSLQLDVYRNFIKHLFKRSDTITYVSDLSMYKVIDCDDDVTYVKNVEKFNKKMSSFIKQKAVMTDYGITRSEGKEITFLTTNSDYVIDCFSNKDNMRVWSYPNGVEDICFYKNRKCVFASVSHEDIFCYYTNDEDDILFLQEINVAFTSQKINNNLVPTI